MNIMNQLDAFVPNRDKLCTPPELADVVHDKVERNEVLEFATIHQELKLHEVKDKFVSEEENQERNPYDTLLVQNMKEPVVDTSRNQM